MMNRDALTPPLQQNDERLRVRVLRDLHGPVEGALVNLDAVEASLTFARHEGLRLPIGQPARLHFESPRMTRSVEVLSHVTLREDVAGGTKYTFRFAGELDRVQELIREALSSIYNRRATYRVVPDETLTAAIDGFPLEERTVCELDSLSIGGVGIKIPFALEEDLTRSDRLSVFLNLPGTQEPLQLECFIRNRRMTNAGVALYGLEFDLRTSPDIDRSQQQIGTYVIERQQALLSTALE